MRHEPLRVAFVPGVTPDKWARTWAERFPDVRLELSPVPESEQETVLYDGRADLSFLRLPTDRDRLHVIPLYEEQPVVVVPKGHFVEAADEVTVADLADEHLLQDPAKVPEWRAVSTEVRDGTRAAVTEMTMKQAVETVGAGVGIVIVPLSVARLHDRKDVVHRPVTDVATTQIGLAWLRGETDDEPDPRVETFIGVVRGRRATSSRGTQGIQPPTGASMAKVDRPSSGGKPGGKPSRQMPPKGRPSPPRGRRGGRR